MCVCVCVFSEAMTIDFSWMTTASIKLMTRTMVECLILNKLGRRTVKLCQRVRQRFNVNCRNVSIFIVYFISQPNRPPFSPILFGLGKATHSELLGTKRVKRELLVKEPGCLVDKNAGLVIERLRVPIPAGAAADLFSPEITLCADSFGVRSTHVLPQWHVKREQMAG